MSRLLVDLRGDRTQTEVAELAHFDQPRISRLERGVQVLGPDDAAVYADALGATPAQRDRLIALVTERTQRGRVKRQVLQRSGAIAQARILELQTESAEVRSWVPDAFAGVLQSAAYTQAMLDGQDLPDPGSEWWAARRARTALLEDTGRQWFELVGEAALRWVVGSGAVTAAQIEHVIELSERPNVHVAYLDFATPHPGIPPQRFHIYESGPTLEVATDLGATWVTDPTDVERFRTKFETLWDLAARGDRARDQMRKVARSVRAGR